MPPNKRTPPGGLGRRSGNAVVATNFNVSKNNLKAPRKQTALRRLLGPGELAAIQAYRAAWPRLRVIEGGRP